MQASHTTLFPKVRITCLPLFRLLKCHLNRDSAASMTGHLLFKMHSCNSTSHSQHSMSANLLSRYPLDLVPLTAFFHEVDERCLWTKHMKAIRSLARHRYFCEILRRVASASSYQGLSANHDILYQVDVWCSRHGGSS